MSFKVAENAVWVSNSLDQGETPSYSAYHLYPSCFAYGTLVVLGGLRVNISVTHCQIGTAAKIDKMVWHVQSFIWWSEWQRGILVTFRLLSTLTAYSNTLPASWSVLLPRFDKIGPVPLFQFADEQWVRLNGFFYQLAFL